MSTVYLLLFAVVCLTLLVWGLREKARVYEFPFLAGAVFTGFVLPQLIGLQWDSSLPEGSYEKTCLVASLCAAMCLAGYLACRKPLQRFDWEFNDNLLLGAGGVLMVIAIGAFVILYRLPDEDLRMRQWTGVTVAYNFFVAVVPYALAISLHLFLKHRSLPMLLISAGGVMIYAYRILIAGQRKSALEFTFIVALSLFFAKGATIPRPVMLGGLLGMAVALNSVGDYREVSQDTEGRQWHKLREIPLWENMRVRLTEGGHELRNAAHMIEARSRLGDYDYGLFHWNTLIFNFVPAQLVGEEAKESLMAPTVDAADALFSYEAFIGSTHTGLVDAFGSFWYLGCLKFFLVAFCMRKLFLAAREGHVTAQLLYAVIVVSAMHTITHHTQWFVSPWVHMSLFLLPCLLAARVRRQRTHVRPTSPLARPNPVTAP